jgi:hypothetical protein
MEDNHTNKVKTAFLIKYNNQTLFWAPTKLFSSSKPNQELQVILLEDLSPETIQSLINQLIISNKTKG